MTLDLFETGGTSPPEHALDFQLIRQSTIFLLEPPTDSARAWVEEHIPADATRFGAAIVVEHRYIADIVARMAHDGLTVEEI